MRTLQTALAQVHGARSGEPHPLLVALSALEEEEDEADEEEDDVTDLDIGVGALSLAETEDGSMQFFGTRPSPLARRATSPMLPTAATMVRLATFHHTIK
jgi:hypothetical protein